MKTRSLWHSFQCAYAGLRDVLRHGRNARIHVAVAVAVVAVAALLEISRRDWAILALTIGAVLAAEAANTSIEHLVDLVSPEHHELARRAKDCAAAAVLLLVIAAVLVGLLILGPPLLATMQEWHREAAIESPRLCRRIRLPGKLAVPLERLRRKTCFTTIEPSDRSILNPSVRRWSCFHAWRCFTSFRSQYALP